MIRWLSKGAQDSTQGVSRGGQGPGGRTGSSPQGRGRRQQGRDLPPGTPHKHQSPAPLCHSPLQASSSRYPALSAAVSNIATQYDINHSECVSVRVATKGTWELWRRSDAGLAGVCTGRETCREEWHVEWSTNSLPYCVVRQKVGSYMVPDVGYIPTVRGRAWPWRFWRISLCTERRTMPFSRRGSPNVSIMRGTNSLLISGSTQSQYSTAK